jgi:hypothetical protein
MTLALGIGANTGVFSLPARHKKVYAFVDSDLRNIRDCSRGSTIVPPHALRGTSAARRSSSRPFSPRPGRYRLWSQFKRRGQVFTVSFTVEATSQIGPRVWTGVIN